VGWLRAPRPVVLRLARVKGALNLGVGAFDQLAALELLNRYDEICESRRRQAESHMRAMHAALVREVPDWPVEPAEGGWSLWVPLPSGSAAAFAQVALRHGVAVAPGGASSPDQDFPDCVRVCFGPAPPLLEEAAHRLPRRGASSCPPPRP
jgi:DNA-binding transcriptional MocR family regulator